MLYPEFFQASWKLLTLPHNGVGFLWLYLPRLGTAGLLGNPDRMLEYEFCCAVFLLLFTEMRLEKIFKLIYTKNSSQTNFCSPPPPNFTWTLKTDSTLRFSRGKRELTIKEFFCYSVEYGEKENDDLRERYNINKEDFPVYKLFKQNEATPIDFTGEIKVDELSKFVKTNSRLWIGMNSVWKTSSRNRVIA